ncbi:MAG: DegT/DnrJ/EryC1/StrS family aminotransferase [Chthoniobacterales bacterium]|nr:DegT/DnrJ/EryC1/StrS family aminotransferase [Chthoniobacterales bacterium]
MSVPLLDLRLQYTQVKDDVQRRIEALCESQQFILGRAVEEIEEAIRDYTGCGHAIGTSSGTDALLAILMAMGIGRGDAVITTPYTFFATAGCIHRVGAEPVFVDIDAATYNMDPAKLEQCLRKKCRSGPDGRLVTAAGNRVRAIMPVHLFGCVCDMDRIGALAKEFDLPVIEDAAQAIGADYPSKSGKTQRAGAIGEASYFSFFPSKNLGAFGDAGMATCREADLAAQIKLMRNHGMGVQYHHEKVGGNFRLDALQAVVLSAKLSRLDEWHAARRHNAALYREEFGKLGLLDRITLPVEPYAASGLKNHHIYHQYVIRVPDRDKVREQLTAAGIGCAVYYPVPLHLQECFAPLGHSAGDFPESEKAARESLALPIYPELTGEQIREVTGALASVLN